MAEDLRGRLAILKEIEKAEARIVEAKKSTVLTEEKIKKEVEAQKKKVIELAKELKQLNLERLKGLASEEQSLDNLGILYKDLVQKDRERILSQFQSKSLTEDQEEAIKRSAEINKEIAQLGREDVLQRAALTEEYNIQQSILANISAENQHIVDNLTQQNELANNLANLTKNQKSFLEKQLEVYKGIKDSIAGVLDTAALLTSNMTALVGIAVIGLGKIANAAGKVRKELGGVNNEGATFVSFFDDNAVSNLESLSDEFGRIDNISTKLQTSTSLISRNMGITGEEAANLIGNLTRAVTGSAELSLNMIKTAQQTAILNNVIPKEVLVDLSKASKQFALYSKEGAKNLLNSAIAARQMGTSLETLTTASSSLLDFESSITAELELQALTGRSINLERARQLAYAEDDAGMMKEVVKQLGGVAGWEQMRRWERQAAADLLGIEVEELNKIINNEKQAVVESKKLGDYFSIAGETIDAGLNEGLGITLETLGSSLIAIGQMGNGLKMLGIPTNLLGGLKKVWSFVSGKGGIMGALGKGNVDLMTARSRGLSDKQIAAGFGGKGAKDALVKTTSSKIPQTSVTDKVNQTTGGGGMKIGNVLKGAAAILILSAALFVAAKAFQEFGDVKWPDVALGLGGLAGLAGIAYLLGKSSGQMIQGAIAVAILGAALIPFAFAMSLIAGLDMGSVIAAAAGLVIFGAAVFALGALMTSGIGAVVFGAGIVALIALGAALVILGTGLKLVGEGMSQLNQNLAGAAESMLSIGSTLAPMFGYIAPIAGLSLALLGLAGSLTAVGAAGLFALPTLGALGLVSGAAGAVSGVISGIADSLFGSDEKDDSDALLQEMKGLRADLKSGKVAVYIDGRKVTGTVASISSKTAANSYSI